MRKVPKATASAAVLGVSLLGALLASPAAHAATLGVPSHSGSQVEAYFHDNVAKVSRVELVRHRWYGWQTLSLREYKGGEHIATLAYNCAGQGTYTYRLKYSWYTPDRKLRSEMGEQARFSC